MRSFHFDWGIFFSIIALVSLGLLTLFSIDPDIFRYQFSFFLVGLLFFFIFFFFDPEILFNFKNLFYLLSLASILFTFILGTSTRGSIRWIDLGYFSLQFSEIIKPFFIIFLSVLFNQRLPRHLILLRVLIFSTPLIVLIFKQPDLGNTIIYLCIIIGMLIFYKYYIYLFLGGIMGFFLLPLSWKILADYQKERIVTFLNPALDPQGAGYNALQSAIAVGSGGIWGRGFGRGTQSHLAFLPERHTDFIFASFAEEFGFAGAFLVLILFTFLLYRLLKIALNSPNSQMGGFCLGVLSLLASHFFINIGMNIGILPITGITLPLFSYGGSSLLSILICLGIIQAIHRVSKKEEQILIK